MIVHHTVFETLKQMKIVKPGGGETKRKKKKIRNLFTYSKTIINPQFYPDFIGTHLTFNHQITNHFDEVCITIMITMKMMMMMVVGM